jgi:cytochrome c
VALLLAAALPALADEGLTRGAALFERCRGCHSLDPAAKGLPGPNLAGLNGRIAGSAAGFDYSPAFGKARAAGVVWDEERLFAYLADPEEMFPGTWMSLTGLRAATDRRDLARFLTGR